MREEFFNRDKGGVDEDEINLFSYIFPFQKAHVLPLKADDAGVLLKLPSKLPVPHINGVDPFRTPLEHTICKPSCGSSDIHDDLFFRIDTERIQSSFQLSTSPTHVGDVFS